MSIGKSSPPNEKVGVCAKNGDIRETSPLLMEEFQSAELW